MGLLKGRSTGKVGIFSTLSDDSSPPFKALLLLLSFFFPEPPNLPPTQFSCRETHAPISFFFRLFQENQPSRNEQSPVRSKSEVIMHSSLSSLYNKISASIVWREKIKDCRERTREKEENPSNHTPPQLPISLCYNIFAINLFKIHRQKCTNTLTQIDARLCKAIFWFSVPRRPKN